MPRDDSAGEWGESYISTSLRDGPPDMITSWKNEREEARKKLAQTGRDEAESLQFELDALDWLINDGGEPRSRKEVNIESERLGLEKAKATGRERVRLEVRFHVLERFAFPSRRTRWTPEQDKRMAEGQRLHERSEKFTARVESPELAEGETQSEVELITKGNRLIRIILHFPRVEREPEKQLAALILIHNEEGITPQTTRIARALASMGYAAVVPDLELDPQKVQSQYSWTDLQYPAESLVAVLDYVRQRPEVDRYLIGCIGNGLGGRLCLRLATLSQSVRICFTINADPPSIEQLRTADMRAMISFALSEEDHSAIQNLEKLRKEIFDSFSTSHGSSIQIGTTSVSERMRKGFMDQNSANYDAEAAKAMWSNMIMMFDQELLADRRELPDDQVGIQFAKLSSIEKRQYLERMKADPRFAREVVSGFYAFFQGQLKEDKTMFAALIGSNPELSKERGRVASANFPSYSEEEKEALLNAARNDPNFAEGFVGNSSAAITEERDQKLTEKEKKAIFEIALSSPKNMFSFARSRGEVFEYLSSEDRRRTLDVGLQKTRESDKAEQTGESFGKIKDLGLLSEFNRGLAEGIALQLGNLANEDRPAIRLLIKERPEFAEGLMNGLNHTLERMRKEDETQLWDKYAWMPPFARMLGLGLGMGFARVPLDIRKQFLDFGKKNEYFQEGFGFGFGLIVDKLSETERELGFNFLEQNENSRKGFDEAKNP
jgi:dienelactone hydrolase